MDSRTITHSLQSILFRNTPSYQEGCSALFWTDTRVVLQHIGCSVLVSFRFRNSWMFFFQSSRRSLKWNRRFLQCASARNELRNKLALLVHLSPVSLFEFTLAQDVFARTRLCFAFRWIDAKLQTVLQSIVCWVNLLTIRVEVLYLKGMPLKDGHTSASCGKRCCNKNLVIHLRSLLHFRYYLLEYCDLFFTVNFQWWIQIAHKGRGGGGRDIENGIELNFCHSGKKLN